MTSQSKQTVLLMHNRYREPGGEERSVAEISSLLRSHGHRVELLERSSEKLTGARGRILAGAAMLRGGTGTAEVEGALDDLRPDVVHAHNINPLLGPRCLTAARRAGARVVMHLHNYRLVCAIAIAYRDGNICTRCHGRNTFPGLWLRCRGSVSESAIYAAGLALHQERIFETVERFIAPSNAAVTRLGSLGLPADRIDVLPNFLPDAQFADRSHAASGKYALFAGRLAEEKGVDTAIEAARQSNVPLLIAGAGPDAGRIASLARGAPVRLAGRLSAMALADARRRAAFVLAPSRWDEPCPYSVIEAMAAGLPVLAGRVGGLVEMVGEEATLPPRATDEWAEAMRTMWSDRSVRHERGNRALGRARELFGAERFYSGLMRIYDRGGERP